jgi:outer membrane protein TolC
LALLSLAASAPAVWADDEATAPVIEEPPASVLMPSSPVTTPSASALAQQPTPMAPADYTGFTAADQTTHDQNKTIDLGPFHSGPLIRIGNLRAIRLDATFNEPITLRDVLEYTVRNNLPIRINERVYASQRYQWYNALGGFLPSWVSNLTYSHANIAPGDTVSNSRVFSTGVSLPVFQGGSVFYGAIQQYYRMHAARNQYATSINDALLNAYNAYYNLLLQRALLQIRIKSVEVSETQLRLNQQLFMAGTGTRFAVMQSETQLALDRQAMLQQQFNVRIAALELGYTMNLPLSANLIPADGTVTEADLYEDALTVNDLLALSFRYRPELRQYEYLRLAAARNVQLAASSLYPTASFNINYQASSTSVSGRGGGGGARGSSAGGLAAANGFLPGTISGNTGFNAGPAVGVTTAGVPNVQGTALQIPQIATGTGQITVTPGSSNTTFGTATGATQTAGSGSTVVTTGSGLQGVNGIVGGTSPLIGNVGTSVGAFGGKVSSISWSFNIRYNLGNLGVPYVTSMLAARAVARQALLQANQVFQQVVQQTRSSYLNALAAHEQIDVTAASVASSAEALRLANLRVQHGIGTNLELIQAQRDYINALITQAQAIIASNRAQAQLLHDTGVISVETLVNGYHGPRIGSKPFNKNQTY